MTRQRRFAATGAAVGEARRFAGDALAGVSAEVLENVRLMVSELATNVVQHAPSSFRLTIQRSARELRVEVTDYGGGVPTMRRGRPDAPDGRGLQIVDRLSTRWGVQARSDAGKTVWFTIATGTSQRDDRVVTLHARSPGVPATERRGKVAQVSPLPGPTG